MKSILAIGFALLIVAIFIVFFGFGSGVERDKTEEPWPSPDGLINGTWGTSIEVEYEDGSTDILNTMRPLFEISFRENKVKNFKYILSSKGTSETYNAIEIDMSDFEVLTDIIGEEGQWGTIEVSNNTINLDMDDVWYEVYRIQVDANELETLTVNRTYNLSFTPSGTISYRGSSTSSWVYVPLPSWYYLNFRVRTEDDPYNPEKWIEIELGGELEDI